MQNANDVLNMNKKTPKKQDGISTRKKVVIGLVTIAVIAVAAVIIYVCINFSFTGVAATVNGEPIMEEKVTEQITKAREQMGLTDDAAWQKYLKQYGLTAASLRSNVLTSLISDEAVNQIAEQNDIEVSDTELNEKYNSEKATYSDAEFQELLTEMGMSEDELKEQVRLTLLSDKVKEFLINRAEYPDELYKEFFTTYGNTINGSTGYYQLEYASTDEAKAQDALNRINSGQTTIEEEAKKLTANDSGGLNFDYVIYSGFIKNPDEVSNTLDNLEVGQMSGLIKSGDYIYIVKAVDKPHCNAVITSFDQLDEPTRTWVKNYADELVKVQYAQDPVTYEVKNMNVKTYQMPLKTSYSSSLLG